MSRSLRIVIEVFTAGSFAISALLTALRTLTDWAPLRSSPLSFERTLAGRMAVDDGSGRLSLLGMVAQPGSAILWLLLAAVLVAAVLHMAARGRARFAPPLPLAISAGLALAALWPWVIGPVPLVGLALAAAACGALALGIAQLTEAPVTTEAERRADGIGGTGAWPLAFVAGWVVMSAANALGLVLFDFGLGLERSILLGLLVAALAAVWVQLRLQPLVTFSVAAIWAMIGVAAVTAGTSITIATACVLGISALAVVVVRMTT